MWKTIRKNKSVKKKLLQLCRYSLRDLTIMSKTSSLESKIKLLKIKYFLKPYNKIKSYKISNIGIFQMYITAWSRSKKNPISNSYCYYSVIYWKYSVISRVSKMYKMEFKRDGKYSIAQSICNRKLHHRWMFPKLLKLDI